MLSQSERIRKALEKTRGGRGNLTGEDQMAYLRVHSRAVASYRGRSVLYTWAISGTKGSSGLGSVSIEQIESSTAKHVSLARRRVENARVWLTFRDCQGRAPLVTENVKTDAAVRVDVGVVDPSVKVDLWRLEWVVGREVNRQEEHAAWVWRVTLQR